MILVIGKVILYGVYILWILGAILFVLFEIRQKIRLAKDKKRRKKRNAL